MTSFETELKAFSVAFNAKLPALFKMPTGSERRVCEAMYYSLLNGGKRLRPFLTTQTALLFDISEEISFPVAASLEMLHTYSLIHDDLPAMDNDDFRRGKPTCHKQFDEATAIIAGDGLLTYAFEVLAKAPKIDSETKINLCALLAERAGAFSGMVAGQMLDLQAENSSELSVEDLIKHTEELKTGCLIAYAAEAGGLLGKASKEQMSALRTYARGIGIAFQISDDILDVTGDAALMGKTLGKDALQGKQTFVSLYGLETAKKMAQDLINTAKESLNIFSKDTTSLKNLADFIINRNH